MNTKKVPLYITDVFEPWCYVRDHYGGPEQLPLLVLLENCTTKRGPVIIYQISVDEQQHTITLTTGEGALEISEKNQWKLKHGTTSNGTGRTIFTHDFD